MQLAPSNNAVERFAGAINTQTMPTGMINGKNPFLKSFITSCFLLISLARYMNKASFARSDVCKCHVDNRQADPAAAFIHSHTKK